MSQKQPENTPDAAAAEAAAQERIAPEFSRPVNVERLPDLGRHWTVEATAEEAAALAQRLNVDAVESLKGVLHVKPFAKGDMLKVTGTMTATVRQACVVTLQPLTSQLSEDIDRVFSFSAPKDLPLEVEWTVEDEDLPDPVVDGAIDLGEIVAEQLALSIDPYPRAEGVAFTVPETLGGVSANGPETENPFAALAGLKNKNPLKE